ncbi:hypothetical protein [Corynebacterium cystitidis]|uniref:hypothetical protein n=1 Tax=Corynebacterium cystitidis TaxID=35757 RepID=UPI00211E34E4|nr:hypothetical protein [Corynebacterium cystitidis]
MSLNASSPKVLMIYDPIVRSGHVSFKFSLPVGTSPSVRGFYVDYVGVDVEKVPKELHYNTALGLILNVLPAEENYIVATESPIPTRMASFWATYFDLRLEFTEITERMPLAPSTNVQSRTGVTFGGGKDSAFALQAFSSILGSDNVVALSFTHPSDHLSVSTLRKRRNVQVLSSIRDFGTENVLEVLTDVRHVVRRSHTELYFAPLGVLMWMGLIDTVTISYEYCHYYELENGALHFRRSRPETFTAMSEYYSEMTGRKVNVLNSNRALTELSAFCFLAKFKPESIDRITMCESTSDSETRWCCSCTKCIEFVLYTAFLGVEQHGIDPDYLFSSSPWAEKVRKAAALKPKGFLKEASIGLHVETFAFLLKNLSPERLKLKTEKGIELFLSLRKRYESLSSYQPEGYFPDIIHQDLPEEISEAFDSLLSAYLPRYQPPKEIFIGDRKSRMVPTGELQLSPRSRAILEGISSAELLFRLIATRDYFSDDWQAPRTSLSITPLGGLNTDDIAQNVYMDSVVVSMVPSAPKVGQGFEINISFDDHTVAHSFVMRTPRLQGSGSENFNFVISDSEEPDQMRDVDFSATPHRFRFRAGIKEAIVRLSAKRNLEPWNWGRAATVIVEAFRVETA